jgi:signal transduction histidine kinase
VLEVSDEGSGIEPELLPKVFDRFFTTENPRTGNRGTGLGLAIAKSIATANGGTISVRSELGSGSSFTVLFPST